MHGLEISESGLAQARANYPQIQFHSVDLMDGVSMLPMAGNCDVVISTEVIEHVFLPRIFAKNCRDLLKSGGTLIISTPYHGYLKNLVLALTDKLDAHFTALWDYGHIKFWSKADADASVAGGGI
jgi:2-polyprenyl-6-hydroxyphenyl methylase/3-demethylubiquinone-9 3-methyltransferase